MTQVMIAEKYWEACGGQAINEEVQVTIAAQAALLLLGMEHDFFPNVQSILVYPGAYVQQQRDMWSQGPTSDSSSNLGEAWFRGPVVLSWADAKQNGQHLAFGQIVVPRSCPTTALRTQPSFVVVLQQVRYENGN